MVGGREMEKPVVIGCLALNLSTAIKGYIKCQGSELFLATAATKRSIKLLEVVGKGEEGGEWQSL